MTYENYQTPGIISVVVGLYCLFCFGLSTRGQAFSDDYKRSLEQSGVGKTMFFYTSLGTMFIAIGIYMLIKSA